MLPKIYRMLFFYSSHLELSQVEKSHTPREFTAPESLTLTVGLDGSLEEMLTVALSVPVSVGSNVAVTVQELPADIVAQSFV